MQRTLSGISELVSELEADLQATDLPRLLRQLALQLGVARLPQCRSSMSHAVNATLTEFI